MLIMMMVTIVTMMGIRMTMDMLTTTKMAMLMMVMEMLAMMMKKKNKFVLNSAKILSPDQTDVLQNAQEFTQNKAHGRWCALV